MDSLHDYKTKLAALALAVLAANEVVNLLPADAVVLVLYLAGASGLYGLRDAVERLKQKLDQVPTKS